MGDKNDFSVPNDPTSLCNFPSLEWYKTPIFNSAAPSMRPFALLGTVWSMLSLAQTAVAASVDSSRSWLASQKETPPRKNIVASHDESHSAEELCEDPMAWGPDFVSFYEGVFCDLEKRKLWPLCKGKIEKNCFDWEKRALVDKRLKKRGMEYKRVEVWK
jgi:hypothetical protein